MGFCNAIMLSMRSPDTTAASYRAQMEAYRRMSADQRLELAMQLSNDLRAVTADGVRNRHPEYDTASVDAAVLHLTLGADIYRLAFSLRGSIAP